MSEGVGTPPSGGHGLVPPEVRFGVATAGFEIEGGFNGPGEPANNWIGWERSGRVEPSGAALGFWSSPDEVLDRAASIGCDAFGLTVEWARVEPRPGEIDHDALARYRGLLDGCHERGMEPWVTLHHFTHPAWLGEELWLTPGAPDRFAAFAAAVAAGLDGRCRRWVTVHAPATLALSGWVAGTHPPGRRLALRDALCVLDNLVAGHVLAGREVHRVLPEAEVALTAGASPVYELGPLLADLLMAPALGVPREALPDWLDERRRRHDAAVPVGDPSLRALRGLLARASSTPAQRRVPPGRAIGPRPPAGPVWPARALDLAYDDPVGCRPGVMGAAWGDPLTGTAPRLPGRRTAGDARRWSPWPAGWEVAPDPEALAAWLRARSASSPETGLWVVDEGLPARVRHGRPFPRRDGRRGPAHLRSTLGALVEAVAAGAPVRAHLYRSLVDGYEWGSFEPRRGLFGFDRRSGRWMETDALGHDTPATYRRLVAGVRAGDRAVLDGD